MQRFGERSCPALYVVDMENWVMAAYQSKSIRFVQSMRLSPISFHFGEPIYMNGVCEIFTLMYILHSIRGAYTYYYQLYGFIVQKHPYNQLIFYIYENMSRYHVMRLLRFSFLRVIAMATLLREIIDFLFVHYAFGLQ